MWRALRVLLALLGIVACAQPLPYPTTLNPSVLYAGSSAAQLTVFNQNYRSGLTALWNGAPRPTAPTTYNPLAYTVSLTAADLAAPELAVLTMIDAKSGAIVDTVTCPVAFNVKPTGLAVDPLRNLLYIATPPQPGDSRFPPNSLVAIDLASGNIGSALQISSALGDVALSDDASALYLVVEGGNVVRRVDPQTFTAVGDFNFRPAGATSPYPGLIARDFLIVMPGQPATLALQFAPQLNSSYRQIAIFDSGTQRLNTIAPVDIPSILFSPDGHYLFTGRDVNLTNVPPNSAVFRYNLDSTGIPKQTPLYAAGGGSARPSAAAARPHPRNSSLSIWPLSTPSDRKSSASPPIPRSTIRKG